MPWIKQGGAELIAVQTAYQLQKLGHQVRLAALFVDASKMDPIAQKISYVMPFRWISNLCQRSKIFLYFSGPFFLFWLTLKNASWADILFPHSLPAYWIASIVGKFYRKRVVWLCNEPPKRREIGEVGFVDWLMWRIADSFLDRLFVRRIGTIIVYSEGIAREIRRRYEKRATLTRLGINFDFFSKSDKERVLKLQRRYHLDGKFVLLMVGKLHPQKNQRLGVEVLKRILPKISQATLVLVGEGPDEEELKVKSGKLKVSDQVIFAGFCPPEVVRAWYGVSDLVLFPSVGQTAMVSQSWGFIPFEALCQKKISIVSEDCGAAEVLGKKNLGIICRPTAEDFSQTVLSVFKNRKGYEQMGERGYGYVKHNLSWEQWGRKIEKIL